MLNKFFAFLIGISMPLFSQAEDLKVGDPAPTFTVKNQDGNDFSLTDRKGHGWTVLYFYPKAETPGCTKQACAFRDTIQKIKAFNAEVYGVSSDTVGAQKGFHEHHQLKFDLLADVDSQVIKLYGAKMPIISIAKRWTFIIDPNLNIRWIEKDVDPMTDATRVAEQLRALQKDQ